MKARDRALTAIEKWTGVLAEVEADIQALRESDVSDVVSAPDKFDDVTIPAADFKAPEPQPDVQ
jgi:hypothetical protein